MELKDKPKFSLKDEIRRARESLGKVIGERWWVEEYAPAYNTGGYYDQDIPEQVVDCSPYFDTKDEAEEHMEKCAPSKDGNKLRIRHQNRYERIERYWL